MKVIKSARDSQKNHFAWMALLFMALVSCNTEPKQDQAEVSNNDLIAASEEVDSLFLVAFNAGDLDAMMKLYWNSPELRLYTPGEMQLNGFDAVKTSFMNDFAANKGAKIEYTDVNNMVFNDVVVGHGTFRITIPVEGGSPMVFDGRYSEVKAFKDGKMVIVLDHASVPMAPPEVEMPTDSLQ